MARKLPIEYTAIIRKADGHTGSVNLEESGWMDREDVQKALIFTLQPKTKFAINAERITDGVATVDPDLDTEETVDLPIISVHLSPLPDGTERKLVYLSRVFGRITMDQKQSVSEEGQDCAMFRLYCVGWKADIAGREVRCVTWAYPGGSVVIADEPPYTEELLDHYQAMGLPHVGATYEEVLALAKEHLKVDE